MKKTLVLTLCLFMILGVLMGCAGGTQKEPTPEPTPEPTEEPTPATQPPAGGTAQGLKDGTYTAESEHTEHGWYGATVTIKDGKYMNIDFVKYDSEGNKVDMSQYKHPPAVEAMEKYPQQLIEVQDASKVDAIAGATSTYNGLQEIMGKIREQANQ